MSEQGTRAKHGKDQQRTQPQPDTLKRNQPAQTVEKIKKFKLLDEILRYNLYNYLTHVSPQVIKNLLNVRVI